MSDNSSWTVLIGAGSAFIGAVFGSVVRPLIDEWLHKRRQRRDWKREALQEQLTQIYRILYEKMVIMPEENPEQYFSDYTEEDFHEWLQKALAIMIPKLHLLPDQILDRIHEWQEIAGVLERDAKADVRFLYKHIEEHFRFLRKELRIS